MTFRGTHLSLKHLITSKHKSVAVKGAVFEAAAKEVSTERNGALLNQGLRMRGRSCGAGGGGGVAVQRESKLPENRRGRGGERRGRDEGEIREGREVIQKPETEPAGGGTPGYGARNRLPRWRRRRRRRSKGARAQSGREEDKTMGSGKRSSWREEEKRKEAREGKLRSLILGEYF